MIISLFIIIMNAIAVDWCELLRELVLRVAAARNDSERIRAICEIWDFLDELKIKYAGMYYGEAGHDVPAINFREFNSILIDLDGDLTSSVDVERMTRAGDATVGSVVRANRFLVEKFGDLRTLLTSINSPDADQIATSFEGFF
jgi:hypothetical protein